MESDAWRSRFIYLIFGLWTPHFPSPVNSKLQFDLSCTVAWDCQLCTWIKKEPGWNTLLTFKMRSENGANQDPTQKTYFAVSWHPTSLNLWTVHFNLICHVLPWWNCQHCTCIKKEPGWNTLLTFKMRNGSGAHQDPTQKTYFAVS